MDGLTRYRRISGVRWLMPKYPERANWLRTSSDAADFLATSFCFGGSICAAWPLQTLRSYLRQIMDLKARFPIKIVLYIIGQDFKLSTFSATHQKIQ